MNEEQTASPKDPLGVAGNATGERDDSQKNLNIFPDELPSTALSQSVATPSTATSATDGGDGSVIEPPQSVVASPAMPQPGEEKELEYSLTLKQVPAIIREANRHEVSMRSLTRYCQTGDHFLKCRKIKTTYGQEWLVNKESLNEYIDNHPILTSPIETSKTPSSDTPDSGVACNASDAKQEVPVYDETLNKKVPPGTDTSAMAQPKPTGEDRTLAELLIENSRLFAQNETKDELIAEMKEDKDFLREQVREDRKHRGEVKEIADGMLKAITTMATVNRLNAAEIRDTINREEAGPPKGGMV